MVCRHSENDPECSSFGTSSTPDASNYEILEAERVGSNLVLKVKYPNCAKVNCYEGEKVLVFRGVKEADAMKWKRIDPHFRKTSKVGEAPSPDGRFPPTPKGWNAAIAFAKLPNR